ncbi:hypothetical protein A0H81_03801 [Grifola frondosa]|uniref:Uncharacterized protein n=1 Tax=Grifola frondosa TaxID=5627 RepID=A0A1C7MJJ1_GRIFR|nr:hypothetical protein A0H81_03801 [Grifola frondosa]
MARAITLDALWNQAPTRPNPGEARAGYPVERRPDGYTYTISRQGRHFKWKALTTNPLVNPAAPPIDWTRIDMSSQVYLLQKVTWTANGKTIEILRGTPCTIKRLASRVGSQQGPRIPINADSGCTAAF